MTQSENCRILREKELHLIRRKTDDKGPHAVGGRLLKTREAILGKEGRGSGRSGPRPPAQLTSRPNRPPFDLAAIQTIYSPKARRHGSIDSPSAAEEQRRGIPSRRGEGRAS
jgi:hypothetical protein